MSVLAARFVTAKGEALIEARRVAGWSQSKLSYLADVSIRTLVRAEKGDRIWTQSAQALAKALEREIDDLFEVAA